MNKRLPTSVCVGSKGATDDRREPAQDDGQGAGDGRRPLAVPLPEHEEAALFLSTWDAVFGRVAGDPAVWAEESERGAAPSLPWPLKRAGDGYAQLLRIVCATNVDGMLAEIEADGIDMTPMRDPGSADFQLVLRVAKRVTDAVDVALREAFSTPERSSGRLSIKRALMNWAVEVEAAAAARAAGPKRQAFAGRGLSKTAAYRALIRTRDRG